MKIGKAQLLILTAGILWGTLGLFVRFFNNYSFSSQELVSIRAASSLIIFAVYIFIKDKNLFRIKIKDIWIFFGSGIISFIGFNVLYINTISLSSLSIAAVLLYTSPIFVMLFSALLFKEKLTVKKIISLLLAFSGSVLVSGIFNGDGGISTLGFIMGLGSGLGYGLYSIFTRYGLNRYNTITVTFYTFLFAVVGCFFTTDFSLLLSKINTPLLAVTSVSFGIVTCVFPYILYNLGLRQTETGQAAIIACIEPVTATLFSAFILKEPFDFIMLIGILLVISAIIILNSHSQKDTVSLSESDNSSK